MLRIVRVAFQRGFGLLFTFSLVASTGHVVDFDQDQAGKAPPGWTISMTNMGANPRWVIRRDQTAPTQPYVLAEVSSDPNGARYPVATLDGVSLKNGDVSVRLKAVSGRQVQAGGVVFRYRDQDNYYLARVDARGGNVALYRVEAGVRTQIDVAAHNIEPNTWRILKISVRGDRLQVYMNHRRILQAYDSTFTGAGGVGLWTVGDAVTYFDDFRVTPRN